MHTSKALHWDMLCHDNKHIQVCYVIYYSSFVFYLAIMRLHKNLLVLPPVSEIIVQSTSTLMHR